MHGDYLQRYPHARNRHQRPTDPEAAQGAGPQRSPPITSSRTSRHRSRPGSPKASRNDSVQAIIINGGTGISRRDSTFEAVDAMLEKRLDGFGEVFRYLTYQDIGSPAIMSRATAGIIKGRVLFSTPGSENAVRLAMEKLILPELGHLVKELTK